MTCADCGCKTAHHRAVYLERSSPDERDVLCEDCFARDERWRELEEFGWQRVWPRG